MAKSNTAAFATGLTLPNAKRLEHVDFRSDEEIIAAILNSSPVTSELNVWAFRDNGFEKMPPWQKRNIIAWVRIARSKMDCP